MGEARIAVSMNDVTYVYDTGTVALKTVTLHVVRGQVLAIVGPSGCGKSTLLRLIAGILDPSEGAIRRDTELETRAGSITMVFQGDTLLPWLTVEQNASLYSVFQGVGQRRRERAARSADIAELLDLVGIGGFAAAYPYQLSGGMKRRLAFVAAAAPRPEVLLLDEPFGSVDEPTRIQIHQDILKIIRQRKMTVVLVTHDLAEAASLADTICVMAGGPGRIIRERQVDFGPHRDVFSLRQRPEFLALYGALWQDLSPQLAVRDGGLT
jgi:NitT/TauT family transport system ATP-binding protein